MHERFGACTLAFHLMAPHCVSDPRVRLLKPIDLGIRAFAGAQRDRGIARPVLQRLSNGSWRGAGQEYKVSAKRKEQRRLTRTSREVE